MFITLFISLGLVDPICIDRAFSIKSYESWRLFKALHKKSNIIALFTAARDKAGIPWCPDCAIVEPVGYQKFEEIKKL